MAGKPQMKFMKHECSVTEVHVVVKKMYYRIE